MMKKFLLSIPIAMLAIILACSAALAQKPEQDHLRGGRRVSGKIAAVGATEFILEARQGEQRTIFVDDGTQYRNAEGDPAAFGDLQVGMWVAGIMRYNDQGEMVARLVILFPDDYDPSQRLGMRARGHVTSVDMASESFSLHTFAGEDLDFQVTQDTIYLGGVESLEDLEAGMQASIGAIKQNDGSRVALVVLARKPLVKHAGTVADIDLANSSFTIDTRQGKQITFQVDVNTRFSSRDGSVEGLEDLQPGMIALVVAKESDGDTLLAAAVAAGTADELPQFDLRVEGKVVVVKEVSFILQARNGEQYTFKVDGETKFRSLGGWLDGLEDVREGMHLGVGADQISGGYLARLVVAGRRPLP